METYKNINGYDNYQVSDCGNVISLKRKIILKQRPNNNVGYMQVMLWHKSKGKYCYVHRLVAETFVDNPNNYAYVKHIDGDKHNNSAGNLAWSNNKFKIEE